MEQLSEAQKTAIKKSSSDRPRLLLHKAGFDEEFILGLNTQQLMLKRAEYLLIKNSDHEVATPVDPERERALYEHEQMMKKLS